MIGETGVMLIALYGALLGARHALEPDHLAAVSTMAAHGSTRAGVLRISAAWGAGHASLIILTGVLLTAFGWEIPPHLAGRTDLLVGLASIAVGAWTLAGVRRDHIHLHRHAHGTQPEHLHFHVHRHGARHDAHPQPAHWLRRPLTAYAVGTLHGIAGSGVAAALAVLVAPTSVAAVVYLLSFGLGSLLGMVTVGAFALWPIIRASSRGPRVRQLVQGVAGTMSVIIGLLLAASML